MEATLVLLGETAARRLTDEVRADAAALWEKLLELYEGKAHKALGYASWGAYFTAEFGQHGSYGYRLLDAARVAKTFNSPIGESKARELLPLRDDPDTMRAVYAGVQERGPVTAGAIRGAVKAHINGMAAESNRALNEAAAGMSDDMRQALSPQMLEERGTLDAIVTEHPAADPAEAAAMLRSVLDAVGPQIGPLDRSMARDLHRTADHLGGW